MSTFRDISDVHITLNANNYYNNVSDLNMDFKMNTDLKSDIQANNNDVQRGNRGKYESERHFSRVNIRHERHESERTHERHSRRNERHGSEVIDGRRSRSCRRESGKYVRARSRTPYRQLDPRHCERSDNKYYRNERNHERSERRYRFDVKDSTNLNEWKERLLGRFNKIVSQSSSNLFDIPYVNNTKTCNLNSCCTSKSTGTCNSSDVLRTNLFQWNSVLHPQESTSSTGTSFTSPQSTGANATGTDIKTTCDDLLKAIDTINSLYNIVFPSSTQSTSSVTSSSTGPTCSTDETKSKMITLFDSLYKCCDVSGTSTSTEHDFSKQIHKMLLEQLSDGTWKSICSCNTGSCNTGSTGASNTTVESESTQQTI